MRGLSIVLLCAAALLPGVTLPRTPRLGPAAWAAGQPGTPGSPPATPRGRRSRSASPEPQPTRPATLAPAAEGPVVRDAPMIEEPRGDADRPRGPSPITVPRSGPGPSVAIPLADGPPGGRLPAGELPPAWSLKRFVGRAQFEVARDEGRTAFRLASRASSFALHRDVAVDVTQFPVLTWSWKVVRLPARGDVRDPRADDQAAQVYLVFPRAPAPRTASDVLGYVWDSRAPVGLRATHRQWSNVRVIVLESGEGRAGRWVREERNVRDDYAALFGREAPPVGRIALMTDSDHTAGQTEAWFADLALARIIRE